MVKYAAIGVLGLLLLAAGAAFLAGKVVFAVFDEKKFREPPSFAKFMGRVFLAGGLAMLGFAVLAWAVGSDMLGFGGVMAILAAVYALSAVGVRKHRKKTDD